MEKDQLNLPPAPKTEVIPRLNTFGDEVWFDQKSPNGGLRRLAWIIAGFNIGFILVISGLLGLSAIFPMFRIQRTQARAAEPPIIIIVPSATRALPVDDMPTLAVAALPTQAQSNAVLASDPLQPTATLDTKATARANNRATQQAAFALTPSPTNTPFPTPSPIPPTATPAPPPVSYRVEGVRFYQQEWNNCGPANLAMGLSFFNWQGTQTDTASYLKPNTEDKNVTPQQMVDYVNQFTNLRAIWRMAGTLDQVRWLVANGFAVIIESGYEPRGEGWFGHYEIVVGYDTTRNTITIYDSYLGRSSQPQTVYSETQFDQQWQSFNRNYIVIYPPNREAELQNFLGADWYERTNRVKAVQVAQAEATQQGDNPFVWFNLGTSLTAIGRYEEAVAAYERAFELGLPYRMLWYQFNPYEAYIQTGRFDDLFTLANNTLKTTKYVEETFYYKGRAYELQGDYPSAIIEYQNAVSFNPNHSQAVIALNRVKSYQ